MREGDYKIEIRKVSIVIINLEMLQIHLIPVMDKIKELNCTEFYKIAKEVKAPLSDRNITVFLPSDEAFASFAEKLLETVRNFV